MLCRFWEALATVTLVGALGGSIIFDIRMLRMFWQPTDGNEQERFRQLQRRFLPWWGLCTLVLIVSLIVIVIHCVDE
jgi:hypothetical protein